MARLTEVSSSRCFGGLQKVFSFPSSALRSVTRFGVYLPPKAIQEPVVDKFPVLYWLSGLTCTEENFIVKSGFQRYAAEHNVIVVNPDTSPRGCQIQGEDDSYDFGTGAGFYVDATQQPWATNYRMYSYVTEELPTVIAANFVVDECRQGVFGHSMGGHGALVCALRRPDKFASVSALAPICNPIECAWGQKAFTGYLGADKAAWQMYDACALARSYKGDPLEVLVDQGSADAKLLEGQLLPDNLILPCTHAGIKLHLRQHDGYDHGFFFVATFIEDHIKHHANKLAKQ